MRLRKRRRPLVAIWKSCAQRLDIGIANTVRCHRFPAVTLPPKSAPRERWLTRNEAARLLWAARRTPHLARFILLGIYTGSRSGALLAAQWSWVDLIGGTMHRRAPGTGLRMRRSAHPRSGLGKRIIAHLRRWRRLDGGINGFVVHYDGQRIQKMRRSWRTATRAARLGANVTQHVLRHTRATWMMRAGVPIWEASGALGMSPEMVSHIYGDDHPDFQKRAAEV